MGTNPPGVFVLCKLTNKKRG